MRKDICKIEGCSSIVNGRGLCPKHYQQMEVKGTLHLFPNRQEQTLLFVQACVNSQSDECMIPSFRKLTKRRYPPMNLNGKRTYIGWVVLEQTKGKRPRGYDMRHSCGNRNCCNSRHLSWSTRKDNLSDREKHGTMPDYKGENSPVAKLTNKQVLEIRRRYVKNKRGLISSLVREFGVNRHQIRVIATRMAWKHL